MGGRREDALSNICAALIVTAHVGIAVALYANSMQKNPHYRQPQWRMERAFTIAFCVVWPVSLPIAIWVWRRSPEKRLLDARKRRERAQQATKHPDDR